MPYFFYPPLQAMIYQQLKALIWKNFTVRIRSWEYLLIELGTPLLFLVIFNQVCTKSDIESFRVTYDYEESFLSSFVTPYDKLYIFPNSSAALSLMLGAAEYTSHRAAPLESLKGTDERLMVQLDLESEQEVPMNLKFQVITQQVYTNNKTFDIFLDRFGPDVLQVQYIVTRMFITYWWRRLNRTVVDTTKTEFEVLPLPDPPYSRRLVWRHYVMGWVITMVFLGTACMTAQVIVQEKECGVKENMESMGMAPFTYWLTWLLPCLVSGLLTAYMFASAFFWGNENDGGWSMVQGPEVLLPLLGLYVVNTISFSFMASYFIHTASHTSVIVCTSFVVLRILPPILGSYISNKFVAHVIGCFFYHTGIQLYYILVAFQVEEYFFDNRHWWPFYPILDRLTMVDVLIMMLSNTTFNLFVTWFMESGRGQSSWLYIKSQAGQLVGYFPSNVFRLWFKDFFEIKQPSKTFLPEVPIVPELNRQVLEHPMADMVASIEIRSLVKIFDSRVIVAINSIDVYKDHVTVLLGQNGAGKTTTINMITGALSPTSGTVFVNGHDVTKNLKEARGLMGVCRQKDVLFDQLTCREHLVFYDQLKNRVPNSSKKINHMLNELLLREKSNALARTLSTGEKRKLCVAFSFIGDNQIIILDEPSYGLDPITRFDLWHFLRVRKRGRTILLTTPDLEEADAIGDRIMVMSEGTIHCYGTPNFLRKPCGYSYKLTVVKDYKCDVKSVVKAIKHVLPEARYMKQTEIDFTFLLPEIHTFLYPRLLVELESKENSLNVARVKLVAASIDDIIFCITNESSIDLLTNNCAHILVPWMKSVSQNHSEAACKDKYHQATDFQELENIWLFFQQLIAVLTVQHKFWMNNRRTSIGLLLLPVTLVLMGIILDLQSNPARDPRPVYFTPDKVGKDLVFPVFYEMNSKTPVRELFSEEVQPLGILEQYEFSASLDDSIQNFAESTLTEWSEKKSYRHYTEKVLYSLVSAGKDESSVKLYYRRSFFHADALGMQLLMNAWVKQMLGENFSVQSGVRLHPRRKLYPFDNFYPFTTGATFYLALAMALLPLPFMYNVIYENSSGAKHLQIVSGLSPLAYWMGHLVYDVTVYMMVITPVILALLFTGVANIHVIMAIKVLPAFSMFLFPHIYALQFFFQRPATGVYFMLMVNVFFGVLVGVLLDFHLKVNRIHGYSMVVILAETSTPVYSVCILFGLMLDDYTYRHEVEMYMNDFWSSSIKRLCISWSLVALFEFRVLRVLGYFISMFCEHMFFVMKQPLPEDEDVLTEVSRVESSSYASLFRKHAIVLMKMRKRFYSNMRVFTALHTTSLGIQPNTCLGLLGPSGSGKSTILSILTGRLPVSSGDAYIFGQSLKTELIKSESFESYCPQLDSHQDYMTGREILSFHARLRGVPERRVDTAVQIIIDILALSGQADQLSDSYSVGVKRKISLGSAILGVPKVIYLDEPTLGIEQEVRRNILTILQYIKSRNGTMMLTSHSVEEMEALCSRIAVLVKGNIVRLGSPQSLMEKHGHGHFVTLYVNIEDATEYIILDAATRFILKAFRHAKIFVKHKTFNILQIPDTFPLSSIFESLERVKSQHSLRRYSVNEITMEKVMLMLIKKEH